VKPEKPKGRGGAGRGQGRKAKDGAHDLVQVGIRVTQAQKDKLRNLGGSVWVRRKIDEADMDEVLEWFKRNGRPA